MIETASDAIQLAVMAICFGFSLVRVLRVRNSPWLCITCFYACMLLGNAYWFGYLVVFGETPQYSYVADLCWAAGYLFLLMPLIECNQRRAPAAPFPAAWIPPVVCAACGAYYIYANGYPVINVIDAALMGGLGFFAVRGMVAPAGKGFMGNRFLYGAVLAFVIVEQALWMSSLLLEPGPILAIEPYIVIGFALTLSYAVILACAWRSDDL